ncbi:uncharacterized protein EI90DRAFT_3141505 [Cantharellus anzutake]|uniref:uncharacterized protein n=1 Tax=Cantharellus anzutake TaxID=1750568 RepID=UPI001904E0DD|nr:uncharacterized protein EI90DRAFT_3141505 [Cantharellus anzutake]KAF8308655.1 hypothetical protein EI90DRAFT_3141505 [Cantharellus anzutake]
MSSDKKVIAVLGSTGLQGGSVVSSLLAEGTFAVRALTRNANSDAAANLKAAGAEVVSADLEDVESLKKAFRGAYGVFGVTAKSRDHETQHGKNIVDAAEAEGIKHLIWSTLDDTSNANLHVFHFASKAAVDKYIQTKKVPTTLLFTSVYFNNLTKFGVRVFHIRIDFADVFDCRSRPVVEEGRRNLKVDIPIPSDVLLPSYDASETGEWVKNILKNPNEWIGKRAEAYGSSYTPVELVEALKKKTAKSVVLNKVTHEQFHSKEYRDVIGDELWLNNKYVIEKGLIRDAKLSKRANPNAANLEQYIAKDEALKAFL